MSMNVNSSNQSILIEAKKAFENDGRLDKKEFESLKNMVMSSDLSPQVKEGTMKFLEQAKKDSDGFLWIFGRDISTKELVQLKDLANSMPDNSLAKDLCNTLETALAKPTSDTNQVETPKSHFFDPLSNFISNIFSSHKDENNISAKSGTAQNNVSFLDSNNQQLNNDFYVSQGNGLPSHASDCGPSCATMVLKRFGVFDSDTSGAEGTTKIRSFLGQHNSAIDENQVERSIEHLSGGAVQKTSSSSFSNPSNLINYAKEQLSSGSMPILLTGSPYHDSDPNYDGRHYMVITGIEPNGNIQLADPGGKFSEMSPDRLAHLMDKTDRGTSVLAFNKVS